jgi:hypothetical protein
MSDQDRPLEVADELASAYIDGEATPEEVVRVESDPGLLARADVFRSVAAKVRDLPVAGDEGRESAIAAALAAAGAEVPSQPRGDLEGARVQRRQRIQRAQRHRRYQWIAAAAVVAVGVLAGVRLLTGLGDDGDGDGVRNTAAGVVARDAARTDAASADSADGDGGAAMHADSATGGAAAGLGTDAQTEAADVGDDPGASAVFGVASTELGSFDTTGDLAEAVNTQLAGGAAPTTSATRAAGEALETPADDACVNQAMAADSSLAAVVLLGTATLDREPVEVIVFSTSDGGRVLLVVRPAPDCSPVERLGDF